jgi:hypothetical protein
MESAETIGFITALGRAYAEVPTNAGIDDVSGQDCYSVISDYLKPAVTPDSLRKMSGQQMEELSAGFNQYSECASVTPDMMRVATERSLWHWTE